MRKYLIAAYTSEGTKKKIIEAKNYNDAMEKAYSFAYGLTNYGENGFLYMVTCDYIKK